jgi:hypothetical protein
MASDSQKLDYLWKKLGFGATKTAPATNKEAFNESIPSPLLYRADLILTQSADIPGVIPSATSSIIQIYKDTPGAWTQTIECVEDLTAPDNQTWKTNVANWVPSQFGSTYLVKVYVDDAGAATPQTTGTQLFQAGSGNNDGWFFDYQSGVLNFNDTNIPSVIGTGVTGKSVYISGARYIGVFGLTVPNATGNITFSGDTISNSQPNGNIILDAPGTGIVQISGTDGVSIPSGNTAQRPDPAIEGTLRFNSATGIVEIYTGTVWKGTGEAIATITNQTLDGDGVTDTFTLQQASNAASILVTINGINQTPGVDYDVTDELYITFTTTPIVSDVIQVRFISQVTTVTSLTSVNGSTSVSATTSGNIDFEINNSTVAQITNANILDISASHSLQLPTYTVSQANGLSNVATGQVIYVSDGASGSPCLAVYSGGGWKQVAIGSAITT